MVSGVTGGLTVTRAVGDDATGEAVDMLHYHKKWTSVLIFDCQRLNALIDDNTTSHGTPHETRDSGREGVRR